MNFLTADDALAYRTFRAGRARQLGRKKMPELNDLSRKYFDRLFGSASKSELVSDILEHEFPLAKENEAIHVLYHESDRKWDGCDFCASVPGLAEHTAAAQDKITEASR